MNLPVRKRLLSSVIAATLGVAVFGLSPALAQDANDETTNDEEALEQERMVITGSRIRREGEIAPTPITVITGDDLTDAGVTNVADLLHQLPSTLVGLSPETTNNTIFASGLNNTDLRGLGSNRTLVLVNGRRFIAGAPGSSAVDLNNIPTPMIERIEITTGGASAVYGSDAVAGVVNIITKTSFQGAEIDVSTSRPTQGGGEEEFASLTFGSASGDANFVANLGWARQKQISFMDRDFLRDAPIVVRNPRAGEPDFDSDNEPFAVFWGYGRQTLAAYSRTTAIHLGPGLGNPFTFTDDGQARDWVFGEPLPPLTSGRVDYLGGDGYVFAENSYVRTPLDRINFTGHMNYDLSQNHGMSMEVNVAKTDAYGESSPAFLTFAVMPDNAFLPPGAVDRMGGAPRLGSYLAQDFGNRQYSQERTLARVALGFDGLINNRWDYDAYFASGHVQSDTEWYGEMFEDRFYQAIDAVRDDNGNIVCRDNSGGCVPLNIFGRDQYSGEAYDWVSTDAIRRASIQQHVAGVTVGGDLFDLPAGSVAAAFSAEYRKEKARTQPDPAMREGLLFNNISQPLSGEFDVSEISAEFSIPLLEDMPWVQSLTLETAGRFMDYSTSGTDVAWKVGLNWEVNDDLRVRLNRSKSVRAPNIGELFNPPGQTFSSLSDPCAASRRDALNPDQRDNILANCAAQGIPEDFEPSEEWYGSTRPGFIVGNPELENETAKDLTVGFVYTPSQIDNLGFTVDYWQFEITDVIQSFGAQALVNFCYRSSTLDNPYCPLIERDPDNFEIVNYFVRPVNSAISNISGVDIEANYSLDTDLGRFGFRLIGTYLDERKFNSTGFAEDEVVTTGEQARPRWRHRLITSYTYEDLSAVLSMTHRRPTVLNNEWTPNQNDYNEIPSYTLFDLTTRYNVNPNLQLRAGVLNLFDRTPPRRPGVYSQGQYYDLFGRRITVGLNYAF